MKTIITATMTALYLLAALAIAGEGTATLNTAKAAMVEAQTNYQLIK